MHTRTVTIGGDGDHDVDLRIASQVAAVDDAALALALLRTGFAGAEPVSRRTLIGELSAGMEPPTLGSHMRRLAEGFQILEVLRYICPDVVQPQDEFRFVTQRGRGILQAQAPLDELKLALDPR